MRAAVLRRYGTEQELELVDDLPAPSPAPNQVLLRVQAAGINPLDLRLRSGSLRWLAPRRFPLVLGNDAAGTVVRCGAEVKGFSPGDRVYCMLDAAPTPHRGGFALSGAYAELAITRADTLARIPGALSFEEAAAVPLAALTAYQVLVGLARVSPGQRVLVNGASGGVGTFAVQVAKALGAEVTAVCSAAAAALVRDLHADVVLDYRTTDVAELGGRYDLFYDVAVAASHRRCRRLLTREGMFVSNVATPGSLLATWAWPLARRLGVRRRTTHAWVRPSGEDLASISSLIAAGRVRPIVDRVYPLEQLREAHAHVARGARGKVVVAIG